MDGKKNPIADFPILEADRFKTYFDVVRNRVRSHDRARQAWLNRMAHFIKRRYAKMGRKGNFPWPGASNRVLPLIDMEIEKHKPLYIQSTIGASPPCTFQAMNPESFEKTGALETFFEWLLYVRMRDFRREIAYGADHFCQMGMVVWKIGWDYQSEPATEVINRARLPQDLRGMLAPPNVTEAQADLLYATTGQKMITRRELMKKGNRDQILALVRKHFLLDEDDPLDKKAERILMEYILQSDEETCVIRRRSVRYDGPSLHAIPPQDVIVAPSTTDVQMAEDITHQFQLTETELFQRARDSGWNDNAVNEILQPRRPRRAQPASGLQSMSDVVDRAYSSGHDDVVSTMPTAADDRRAGVYTLWETCCYVPMDERGRLDEGGEPTKCVITHHPGSDAVLEFRALPFAHGMWPYEQGKYELVSKLYHHTRGIAEKLNDLDILVNEEQRAKENRRTISNAPVFVYRVGSLFNPDVVKWIPGQMIPATRTDDVRELPVSNVSVDFDREQQFGLSMIEQYLGSLDTVIKEQGNLTRPRTAREIDAVTAIGGQLLGPRVLLWQDTMMRVYRQILSNWYQFGADQVFVSVVGADAPKHMTKAEIMGEFDLVPSPAALSNPQTRSIEAKAILDTLVNVVSQGQSFIGPEYEVRLDKALRHYLDVVDPREAAVVIRKRTPAEVQAIQQQLAQRSQPQQLDLSGPIGAIPQKIQSITDQARAGLLSPRVRVS